MELPLSAFVIIALLVVSFFYIAYGFLSIFSRVINKTDITFTNDQMILLNKGLKYNLNHKHKNWIKTLALESETAIVQLPLFEQD